MTADERNKLRLACINAGYSVITGSIKDSTNVEVRVMVKDKPQDRALLARVLQAGWHIER